MHSDGLVRIESVSERIPLVYEMRKTHEFELTCVKIALSGDAHNFTRKIEAVPCEKAFVGVG